MNNRQEVYRGVNKYIDYTTGEETLVYLEPSTKKSTAKLRATINAFPYGKNVSNPRTRRMNNPNPAGDIFEFAESWVEVADNWVRV